jgi:integrase
MLTLARREEVAGMRWAELSADAWTLQAERSKNGTAHVAHLAGPTREIIGAQPRVAGCPFVFPGDGLRGPISGYSYIKRKLDAAIATARAEAGLDPMPAWIFHDLRRSGVTALAGMGFAPHVCDRLLNHLTGSIQGVAAVYQRAEFLAERRAALDAWAAYVVAAADGKAVPANVVTLRPAPDAGAANVAA